MDPVRIIIAQSAALDATLRVIERAENPRSALALIRPMVPLLSPEDIVETTVAVAMASIAKLPAPVPCLIPIGVELEEAVTDLCRGWLSHMGVKVCYNEEVVERAALGVEHSATEATHRLALTFWAQALLAIKEGDRVHARRLMWRAKEVATTFGVEAQPAIAWTYAAMYFPEV